MNYERHHAKAFLGERHLNINNSDHLYPIHLERKGITPLWTI